MQADLSLCWSHKSSRFCPALAHLLLWGNKKTDWCESAVISMFHIYAKKPTNRTEQTV